MAKKFLNEVGLNRYNEAINEKLENKVDKETGKSLFSGKYSDLTGKPIIPTIGKLVTTFTSTQSTSTGEMFSGTINLHKISKTGNYEDLLNKPNIPDISNLVPNSRTIAGESLSNNITVSTLANALKVEIGKLMYPVNSIFLSTSSTNPTTSLGFGTWIAWGSGRVPVGVDTSQTEFKTVEKTGGSKTHTLTVDEMPEHGHWMHLLAKTTGTDTVSKSGVHYFNDTAIAWASSKMTLHAPYFGTTDDDGQTSKIGGGKAHTILQPYITCYMWKRTE